MSNKQIKNSIHSFLKRNWSKSFSPREIVDNLGIKTLKMNPELIVWIHLSMMSRKGLIKQVKKHKDIFSCEFCA